MGIIRTDVWMEEAFSKPELFLETIKQGREDPEDFYHYLQRFGMYRPSRQAEQIFTALKKAGAWEKIGEYHAKYKKLWNGPDPDIYIFPVRNGNGFNFGRSRGKSGVTLPGAVFLFLAPVRDRKEWEALFVHEYHHAARMSRLKKPPRDYTLLDSLVFEGLAEHAVLEYVGEEYVSETSKRYSEKQKKHAWQQFFKKYLAAGKEEKIHDDLLFGRKYVPPMMGYALGYHLIEKYKTAHSFSTIANLGHRSEIFAEGMFTNPPES